MPTARWTRRDAREAAHMHEGSHSLNAWGELGGWRTRMIFRDSHKLAVPVKVAWVPLKTAIISGEKGKQRLIDSKRLTDRETRRGHIWSTHSAADLILRHYTDRQLYITGDYLKIGNRLCGSQRSLVAKYIYNMFFSQNAVTSIVLITILYLGRSDNTIKWSSRSLSNYP